MDVTGEREREEEEGHCRVDCGGGGERDNGGGSTDMGSVKIPIFGDLIKVGGVFCKKDDEV